MPSAKSKKHREDWTDSDLEYIRQNWLQMTATEIGEKIGRTKKAVEYRRRVMGLVGKSDHAVKDAHDLTDDQCNFVSQKYLTKGLKTLDKLYAAFEREFKSGLSFEEFKLARSKALKSGRASTPWAQSVRYGGNCEPSDPVAPVTKPRIKRLSRSTGVFGVGICAADGCQNRSSGKYCEQKHAHMILSNSHATKRDFERAEIN